MGCNAGSTILVDASVDTGLILLDLGVMACPHVIATCPCHLARSGSQPRDPLRSRWRVIAALCGGWAAAHASWIEIAYSPCYVRQIVAADKLSLSLLRQLRAESHRPEGSLVAGEPAISPSE